jgi:hypothetical protein
VSGEIASADILTYTPSTFSFYDFRTQSGIRGITDGPARLVPDGAETLFLTIAPLLALALGHRVRKSWSAKLLSK